MGFEVRKPMWRLMVEVVQCGSDTKNGRTLGRKTVWRFYRNLVRTNDSLVVV
jgi:hypothetical protein